MHDLPDGRMVTAEMKDAFHGQSIFKIGLHFGTGLQTDTVDVQGTATNRRVPGTIRQPVNSYPVEFPTGKERRSSK